MNSTYWTDPQPSPRTGTGGALWPLAIHRFVGHVSPEVLADMGQRHAFGIAKYGVGLQANNGRDARVDLYQELLDAVVYCEQLIQEAKPPDVPCPLQVRLQRRLVEILCIVRQLPAGETSTAGEASTAGETSAEGDTSTAAETSSGSAATSAPASATSTAAAGCSAGLLQATIATYNPEETRNFFMSETKAVEPASPAVCHNSGTRFHTASGVSFNLSNPKAEDIRLTDIAHALSRIPRFGGHLDKHYSVANHSLVVLRVFREARPQATAREQLTALLHDAAEAYVGDVITPLKTAM
ncbi:MAG: hypothetical protein FJ100_23485, partial [Deltaproteobacteria bacterium]|nr:hypothetical protein [Deltaproteobacteria bacterium]